MPRSRRITGLLLGLVIGAGLLSRRHPLPGVLAEYTGDALYATAAYLLFALLRPTAPRSRLGLSALAFAVAVEFSQLLRWPWLVELRSHRLGALLLGQGFQFADLLAYLVGIALAWLIDRSSWTGSLSRPPEPDRLPRR